MRNELSEHVGEKVRLRGIFKRVVKSNGMTKVLIREVTDKERKFKIDHIWTKFNREMADMPLYNGTKFEFDAVVHSYVKGYMGDDIGQMLENPLGVDYNIKDISNIVIV